MDASYLRWVIQDCQEVTKRDCIAAVITQPRGGVLNINTRAVKVSEAWGPGKLCKGEA